MRIGVVSNFYAQPFTGISSAAPVWELQTSPTDYLIVLEISANFLANTLASTGLVFGVGAPAARGVGIATQNLIAESTTTDAMPGTQLLTAWSKAPTAPAIYLRRATVNGANGGVGGGRYQHVNWKFPAGIKINPSSSLVLWGITLSTTLPFPMDCGILLED